MENFVKNQLEAELDHNVAQQTKITDEIGIIRSVQNNLNSIAEQPERPHSFFQVNSLAYVPATIIHTGEQYVALGNMGQILMTTQETHSFLERKIASLNASLDLFQAENSQLQKRREIYFTETEEIPEDVRNMPTEISSDFGTAHKTSAGVFEIIEPYKEEERKPVKSTKKTEEPEQTIKDNNWYMRRLEELEREEDGTGDKIPSDNVECSDEDETVLNKVKMIIKECGLYENLSEDSDIKKFCEQAAKESTSNGKNFLNSIIVKALLSESTSALTYSNNDLEENVNTTANDLQALAFLDSIENDL